MDGNSRKLIAFRLYVDDFVGGTDHLTDEEVGCYLRLLIHQFRNDGIDEKRIGRITDSGARNWAELKSKFEKGEDGLFRNLRMKKTREDALFFSEKQSLRAKKRYLGDSADGSTDGNADGLPVGSGSGSNTGKGKEGVGEKPLGYFEKSKDDKIWLESVCRAIGEPPELWVQKFNDHVTATQEFHATLQKWRQHAVSWIKIQIRTQQQDEQRKPKLTGRERQRDNLETLQRNWSIINGSDPDLAQTG